MTVMSELGKGSTFRLTIPSGRPNLEPIQTTSTHECLIPNRSNFRAAIVSDPVPRRVLLAEDNADNRRAIGMLLSHSGHDVSVASNGQEAYDIAQAAISVGNPCDIILMDMQMPIIDGFQATRMLREAGYDGRIYALTAYATNEVRDECLHAGCNDFISKPIDWSELNKMMNQMS